MWSVSLKICWFSISFYLKFSILQEGHAAMGLTILFLKYLFSYTRHFWTPMQIHWEKYCEEFIKHQK